MKIKSIFLGLILLTACLVSAYCAEAKDYVVKSPDGHLCAIVNDDNRISWRIDHDGNTVLAPSAISIETTQTWNKTTRVQNMPQKTSWGMATRVQKMQQKAIKQNTHKSHRGHRLFDS